VLASGPPTLSSGPLSAKISPLVQASSYATDCYLRLHVFILILQNLLNREFVQKDSTYYNLSLPFLSESTISTTFFFLCPVPTKVKARLVP